MRGRWNGCCFRLAQPAPPAPHLVPDWATVHQELKRQGVPLFLRWQAEKAAPPDGLQDRGFCHPSRAWASTLALGMRPSHRAGEKLCVDDAGQGIPVVKRHSGEVREAALVVAVLGASHYTDAAATWPQSLPEGIGSHGRTFAALGGVPELVVPAHLQAAVTQAHRDEPEINRPDTALAHHYGCAVMPARARTPRDKAQVEVGGHVVERWMLARLRPHTCFALADVTTAIHPRLRALKARPFQKVPGSRQQLCETLDRPSPPAAAGAALRICRVATGPCHHR